MTDPHLIPLPSDPEARQELLRGDLTAMAHPSKGRTLGLEFECLRVDREGGRAAPSFGPGGPEELVHALARRLLPEGAAARPILEGGVLSILPTARGNLSLEPGGQIEFSLPPLPTPLMVERELALYVRDLEGRLEGTPFRALYLGHQPVSLPEEIPLRAKPRYEIMDRRLRASGSLGIHMMRATAGIQVTLDFRDGKEAMSMLRGALVMAPFVSALFANSSMVGGRDSGWASFREKVWWNTDRSRCGVPARLLSEELDLDGYLDFALDAEAWFLQEDGELVEAPGKTTFGSLLEEDRPLTLGDFQIHCSTLFPAARLRGGVEVRTADSVSPEMVPSFCALNAGCLYDEEAREALTSLHPFREDGEIRAFHMAVAEKGLGAEIPGVGRVADRAASLLCLARGGLQRLVGSEGYEPETPALLLPLEERLSEHSSPCGH